MKFTSILTIAFIMTSTEGISLDSCSSKFNKGKAKERLSQAKNWAKDTAKEVTDVAKEAKGAYDDGNMM